MVVVKLRGGLGNQMFQYAAGRRLALQLGTELRLDATAYAAGSNRHYALEPFRIAATLATPRELERWLGRGGLRARLAARLLGRRLLRPVVEQGFRFDPAILTLSDDVYLDGYWQSEGYFADACDQLRRDFTFREPLQGHNAELAAQIAACAAVALHVRRGDYVTDERTNAFHGVCSAEFYGRCVEEVAAVCTDPVFFVFSDDLDWARRHLPLPGSPVFVAGNDSRQAAMDLHLMSLCRHHVLSNSTFSWWGAWLGEQPGQLVLAPKSWFRTPELDDRDLVPARWGRLDNAS
jgi:hypothetical protein